MANRNEHLRGLAQARNIRELHDYAAAGNGGITLSERRMIQKELKDGAFAGAKGTR